MDNNKEETTDDGYHFTKENAQFEAFYKLQNLIDDSEWSNFIDTLKQPLPTTFRISGSKHEAQVLLKRLWEAYLSHLSNVEIDGVKLKPPISLSWYPDGRAIMLEASRMQIKHLPVLKRFQECLISETDSGVISRQEAVSMVPPLLLDVQSHHKVLDMCAAPGSKTAQLIESIHSSSGSAPDGFVVANDADHKRCYLMTHQVKRLQSPNYIVVNHDAATMPHIYVTKPDEVNDDSSMENLGLTSERTEALRYDRVLCDVPCSGDGTIRKNAGVWAKWNPMMGVNLHCLQVRILMRGLQLLTVGGRLAYSTCSFNPIENEAVLAAALDKCGDSVTICDVSDKLPELKRRPGLLTWTVMSRNDSTIYTSIDDVPDRWRTSYRPTVFAPALDRARQLKLDRALRILPHDQNTGGFFIAILEKTAELPATTDAAHVGNVERKQQQARERSQNPGRKRKQTGRYAAFGEAPFVFLDPADADWLKIQSFYGVAPDFPNAQLLVRSDAESAAASHPGKRARNADEASETKKEEEDGTKDDSKKKHRTIYFVSRLIRDIVVNNRENLKIINTGVSMFARSDHDDVPVNHRLLQDGITTAVRYFQRKVCIPGVDLITLLQQENPYFDKMSSTTMDKLNSMPVGSVIFLYNAEDEVRTNEQPLIHSECDQANGVKLTEVSNGEALQSTDGDDSKATSDDVTTSSTTPSNTTTTSLPIAALDPGTTRVPPECSLVLAGWRGRASCRVYVPKHERAHLLRLCAVKRLHLPMDSVDTVQIST